MTAFERPKGSGRWAAKFTLRGKQHWVPGGPWPSQAQADGAEELHRVKLERTRTEETCAGFAKRWLEEWPRPEDSTRRAYAAAADRFADHFGSTLLGDVARIDARAWALGVSRRTSQVIGTMYEDAINVGLVDANPFSNLRLPMGEKRPEITAPSMETYRSLLEACGTLGGYAGEFRAMIQFAAWTGVRQGELFGLYRSDVQGELLDVERSRKLNGTLGLPKNGRRRTITLLPPARVLDQVPVRSGSPFLFHSPHGRPLLKGTFGWSWQKVKASAGEPDVRWHDLRHFCATQLLELGLDHFAVSVQLGHTDGGQLVMSRYGHPSEEAARRRLLGAFDLDAADIGSSAHSKESAK